MLLSGFILGLATASATLADEPESGTALPHPQKNTYSVESWWQGSRSPFSADIDRNGSVTLRVRHKNASEVKVHIGEWNVSTYPLHKTTADTWETILTGLPAGMHTYWFEIDGIRTIDVYNPVLKVGTQVYGSVIEIPATPLRPDQYHPETPSGADHIHTFYSEKLGQRRSFWVHTPPDYGEVPGKQYPVLYLRHGGGDHAHSWTDDGRAGIILDNLIAQKRAESMIIVMPECLTDGSWAGGSDGVGMQLLETELFSEIMPFMQKHYAVADDRLSTAIAGLSMGGGQAFLMGLRHPDRFAWIAEFSSGLLSAVEFDLNDRVPGIFEHSSEINHQLELLYLACGRDDPRYSGHLEFAEKLRSAGFVFTFHSMSGAHEWAVWRSELENILQQLFKKPLPSE